MAKNEYLSNAFLLEVMKKWKESGDPKIPDEFAQAFMTLTRKTLNHRYFRGYPKDLKEEMQGEALLTLIANANKFDLEKYTNIFSYFTTFVFNAYIGVIRREYHDQAGAAQYFLANSEQLDLTDVSTLNIIETNEAFMTSINGKKAKAKAKTKARKLSSKPTLFNVEEVYSELKDLI